jgi:hypothetical protein
MVTPVNLVMIATLLADRKGLVRIPMMVTGGSDLW